MAYRVKCPECNSCMSPMHKDTTRYLYCGFCRQYYSGVAKDLVKVDSPFQPVTTAKIEDPVFEEHNDGREEIERGEGEILSGLRGDGSVKEQDGGNEGGIHNNLEAG